MRRRLFSVITTSLSFRCNILSQQREGGGNPLDQTLSKQWKWLWTDSTTTTTTTTTKTKATVIPLPTSAFCKSFLSISSGSTSSVDSYSRRQGFFRLDSHSSKLQPIMTLPEENRGIYFGRYGEPVIGGVERKTTRLSASNRTNNKQHRNKTSVLVQVCAVGMNPVDAKGVIGDKLPLHWTSLRRWMHNVFVRGTRVGFDFAGRVIDVHQNDHTDDDHHDCCPFPHGTVVYGTMPPLQGSFAEYVRVPIHQIARAPTTISETNNTNIGNNDTASVPRLTIEETASLPLVGLTAWQALSPHVIPQESSVLIVGGSGGTGHVAIQVARALGARHVVTVCSTRNIDFVKECGATHVVDYSQSDDVIVGLHNIVMNNLHGQQFDVILDCVTSGDPADERYNYPRRIRHASPSIVTPHHLYQKLGGHWTEWVRAGLARPGIFPHSWLWRDPRERLFWIKFPHSSGALSRLTEWAEQGLLKPRLDKIYPEMTVDTVQQAMEDVLSRRVRGKVAIRVGP